jgi:hypothetical protein
MFSYNSNTAPRSKRTGSQIAMAIALASGAVLGVTALEAPAFAAKKDKKDKKDEAAKTNYSKGFIAVYTPTDGLYKAEVKDNAAMVAAIPAMVAGIETPDDRFASGNLIYSIGRHTERRNLQRQGVGLMLESGKVPPAAVADYNYLAGQLAYQDEDWAAARAGILAAVKAGYTGTGPQALVAETFFSQDMYAEGLEYLAAEVNALVAAGQPVDETWLKRGISVAYNNDYAETASAFARTYAKLYPGRDSWGDAIAIERNFSNFENQETLDILRLSFRVKSLRNERDYVDYIDAADARRLPGEVSRVVEAGISAGLLSPSDVFIAESRDTAKARIKSDQAELPSLESDARKTGSTALTATAAGDAMLSYGKAAQAEEMYTIALGKAGADTQRVLTRLGIAQVDQGKTAEAKATFAKITGKRAAIAKLWAVYVEQKAAAMASEPAASVAAAPATAEPM